MGIIGGIKTLIDAIRWIVREKRRLEADTKAYLSPGRAKNMRLWLECFFKALEDGPANPNYAKLPRLVRWFCGGTKIDNYIGAFGQNVLKSQKLADSDPVLRNDIARNHPSI